MKYGCIGEHLKHSFSKEIHGLIANYDYVIRELRPDEVDGFMREADFLAINVTIPYKETVIPYLSYIDEGARLIGAVNTIVNRDGKLYGYNTDFFGMSALARRIGIDFRDKKVLILGTGGTSKTAYAVAQANGAKKIVKASRTPYDNAVSYTDVYNSHTDAEIIINTTPVGMYPNIMGKPIELSKFGKLCGVLDAIYNPLNTPLILEAKKLKIPADGGLYMLVAQGVRASEIFLDTTYDSSLLDEVYARIEKDKKNIVLIGMPASGKTTVGRILAQKLGREIIDTDDLIIESAKKAIPDIFRDSGEAEFRRIECEAVASASAKSGVIISSGGGVILNSENIDNLSKNSKIYFIDRPLDMLIPTSDRPTASTREAIEKIFAERYDIYKTSADVCIDGGGSADEIADAILKDFLQA